MTAEHAGDAKAPGTAGRFAPGRLTLALGAALLLAATLFVYLPALSGDFIWDDFTNIVDNPTKRDAAGLRRTWTDLTANQQYYPITHTLFWLEHQLFGQQVVGYHLVNVVLHAATAVLLWRFLAVFALPGAFLAAALFALHPLQVESVAWITELKNVLSGLFSLAALLAFARWVEAPAAVDGAAAMRRPAYALSLLLFVAALLSKTAVSTLPAVLLLLLWWRRDRVAPTDLIALGPFFALGLVGAGLAAHVEIRHVGAQGAEFTWSLAERIVMAGKSFWFYLAKLAWPAGLNFIYPRWGIDAARPASYLPAVAALGVPALLWWRRRRLGKGLLAAYLSYAALILPALGLVDFFFLRYSFAQNHFQYLAGIGLIVPAAAALQRAFAGRARALPFLLLAPLGLLSWREAGHFRNPETLWRSVLSGNPASELAHNNLGVILLGRGETDEALGHFQEALRLNPGYCESAYNVGAILFARGRAAEAAVLFERALASCPRDSDALAQLARANERLGRTEEAEGNYRNLLQRNPRSLPGHLGLGTLLARTGRPREALPHLELAVKARPEDVVARFALQAVRESLGLSGAGTAPSRPAGARGP